MGVMRPEWTADFVREAFNLMGVENIENVRLLNDRHDENRPANYCLVEFADVASARMAMLAAGRLPIPNCPNSHFHLAFSTVTCEDDTLDIWSDYREDVFRFLRPKVDLETGTRSEWEQLAKEVRRRLVEAGSVRIPTRPTLKLVLPDELYAATSFYRAWALNSDQYKKIAAVDESRSWIEMKEDVWSGSTSEIDWKLSPFYLRARGRRIYICKVDGLPPILATRRQWELFTML